MADDIVEKILRELELESYIDKFKENKITSKILKLLNEEMIKDLISPIGDRAVFVDYWNNHFKENQLKRRQPNEEDLEVEEFDGATASKSAKITTSMINNVFAKESQKSIAELLENTPNGKDLITVFITGNELTRKSCRGRLCEAIIHDLKSRSITLTNEVAEEIAININKDFPLESVKTWYVAPILKKDSICNKSRPSSGKLISKWRNSVTESRKLQKKINKENQNVNSPQETESLEADDDIKEAVAWLQKNQAPWSTVLENWTKTVSIRSKQIRELKDANLINFFNEWTLYKHPNGYQLIEIDFNHKKLSSVKLDDQLWNTFYDTLNDLSSLNGKDETGNSLSAILASKLMSCDSKVAASLLLLSHLYPPRQMKSTNTGRFKPFIGLSKDSILQIAKIPGDITKIRSKVISKAAELKIHAQPYILVLGQIENIEEVYVVVDDVMYAVQGILEGIDIWFKAFHVFDLEYPVSSQHIWILIQKGIYEFDSQSDPEINSIQPALSQFIKNRTSDK